MPHDTVFLTNDFDWLIHQSRSTGLPFDWLCLSCEISQLTRYHANIDTYNFQKRYSYDKIQSHARKNVDAQSKSCQSNIFKKARSKVKG